MFRSRTATSMYIKLEMSYILLNVERFCNNETILFSYIDFNDPQKHINEYVIPVTPKQTVSCHLFILYKRICNYSNSVCTHKVYPL